MNRQINNIILHCADTPSDMDIDVTDIRRWHVDERGWRDVGYHYVVTLNGTVQIGREEGRIGAHCRGYNRDSIGICVVGGRDKETNKPADTRTKLQKESLTKLLGWLKDKYPEAVVYGHTDFDDNKTCPNFSVEEYK